MFLDDITIGKKLLGGFLIVATITVIVAVVGYVFMSDMENLGNEIYNDRTVPIELLGAVDNDFTKIRADAYLAILDVNQRGESIRQIGEHVTDINTKIDLYKLTELNAEEEAALQVFETAWASYQQTTKEMQDALSRDDVQAATAIAGKEDVKANRAACIESLAGLIDVNSKMALQLTTEKTHAYESASFMMLIITIIAIIFALVFGFVLTRSITNPIEKMKEMIAHLGEGYLEKRLALNRNDEIGVMGTILNAFAENLEGKAEVAKSIAAGDLTVDIVLASDADELGKAMQAVKDNITLLSERTHKFAMNLKSGHLDYDVDNSVVMGEYNHILNELTGGRISIYNVMQEITRVCKSYADNDFSDSYNREVATAGVFDTVRIDLDTIGKQVSKALIEVQNQIESVAAGTEQANASITEVAYGSQKLAENAAVVSKNSDQGEYGLKEVLKAMEDFNQTVTSVSVKAEEVSVLASQANELAATGKKLAGEAEEGMLGITNASGQLNQMIADIRKQMEEIGKVVDIITEISDETNLLALNAAIEAARAGEAGLGFAVVADEVKELAGESRKSAENISRVIADLQKGSQNASEVMVRATTEVEKGNAAVQKTLLAFNKIVEAIDNITQNITEVASASEEQAAAVEEITGSASEVTNLIAETAKEAADSAAISEESTASVDQIRSVIDDVNRAVENLNKEISRFRVSGA